MNADVCAADPVRSPGVDSAAVLIAAPSMMTMRERADLAQLVRRREKLAKADVSRQAAALEADFEAQLAATYSIDDRAWREVTAEAQQAVRRADAEIAKRCRERGIREEFRPSIGLGFWNRGANAAASRRAELRKVAKTRIAVLAQTAKVEIERRSVTFQTEVMAGGLQSAEAKALLERMPTAEQLMPALRMADVEAALREIRLAGGQRRLRRRSWS